MQDPEETRCLFIPRKEAVNLRLMYLFFASLREINYLKAIGFICLSHNRQCGVCIAKYSSPHKKHPTSFCLL